MTSCKFDVVLTADGAGAREFRADAKKGDGAVRLVITGVAPMKRRVSVHGSATGTTILIAGPSISALALGCLVLAGSLLALTGMILIGCLFAVPIGAATGDAGSLTVANLSPAIQSSAQFGSSSAEADVLTIFWDGRRTYGPMSSAARRKIRRTREEIREERRKLLEKTSVRSTPSPRSFTPSCRAAKQKLSAAFTRAIRAGSSSRSATRSAPFSS